LVLNISAFMLSCPDRDDVRRETLANLDATDWGSPCTVEIDTGTLPSRQDRLTHAGQRLLARAIDSGADLLLLLEDDVRFTRHLRSNIERWTALRGLRQGGHFFGSLYNPGLPFVGRREGDTGVVEPRAAYGAQAFLLSRATASFVLAHWNEVPGMQDIKITRLAARVAPLAYHVPSLVQHIGVRSVWGGQFHRAADFNADWRADSGALDARDNGLTVTSARAALDRAAASLPLEPPADAADGAGIVVPAGGARYFANAWVCLHRLRALGCRLPIQVWHLGPGELGPRQRALLAPLDVACVDATAVPGYHPGLQGWGIKPFALLHAPFRHVLLLDADNVAVRDPSFLFDSPPYLRAGAIFWSDFGAERGGLLTGRLVAEHPIWALTGLPFRDEPEFESGQICVDRSRCFRELALATWMNQEGAFWYRFVHGDKDTYRLAWRKLGTPWAMPASPPLDLGGLAIGQHGFDGAVLFQHRVLDKWRLEGNRAIPDFRDEAACVALLADLRVKLEAADRTARARRAPALCDRTWMYAHTGHDVRLLTFLPDGRIGRGHTRSTTRWTIDEDERLVLLTREGEVFHRLTPHAGDAASSWRHSEGLPISLSIMEDSPTSRS
jgi:hypothetical protein